MTEQEALELHKIASALLKATDKIHLAAYNNHIPDLSMTYLAEAETSVRVECGLLSEMFRKLTDAPASADQGEAR